MNEVKAVKLIFATLASLLVVFSIYLYVNRPGKPDADELPTNTLLDRVFNNAPSRGADTAQIVIVEFGDFQCPSCKAVQPILAQVEQAHTEEVRRVWIHSPNIINHPEAFAAAKASHCALAQNRFWQFHDELFANQANLTTAIYSQIASALRLNLEQFQTCLKAQETEDVVQAHRQFTSRSGITATPYIQINDQKLDGEFTFEQIEALIQNELLKNPTR